MNVGTQMTLLKRYSLKGFMSYTHIDNQRDKDDLFFIIEELKLEFKQLTAIDLTIFIDQKDLYWGDRWQEVIQKNIKKLHLFIPIVTPSYFRSQSCLDEYNSFRDYEENLNRKDLMFPIYYIDVPEFNQSDINSENEWLKDLKERQYFDWRKLRGKELASFEIRTGITSMAAKLRDVVSSGRFALEEEEIPNSATVPDLTNGRRNLSLLDRLLAFLQKPRTSIHGFFFRRRLTPAQRIINEYHKLSHTQKRLIKIIYKDIPTKYVGVNDLFTFVNRSHVKIDVESDAELYYRLKDLERLGFLETQVMGPNATLVISSDMVRGILLSLPWLS